MAEIKTSGTDKTEPSNFSIVAVILLSVFAGSFAGPFIRLLYRDGVGTFWITSLRMVAALLVIWPAVLLNGRLKKDIFSISKKDLLWTAAAGFFLAVNYFFWTLSLKYTSIFGSTSIGCIQYLFTVFLAFVFLREKPGKGAGLGALLCFAGIAIIGWSDFKAGGNFSGCIYSIFNALFSAAYFVAGRHVRKTASLAAYTVWINTFAAVLLTAVSLVAGGPVGHIGAGDIALFFGLAILCSLAGHIGINRSLKYVTADFSSMVGLIGPAFAAGLAYVFFRESIRPEVLIGAVFIIGGISAYILINLSRKRKLQRSEEAVTAKCQSR